jgi:hypothetical protein
MFAAISAILIGFAQPADAQGTPKFELGVGYQYMHDNNTSLDFTKGWVVSVGADVVSWFGLVGEFGGSYNTLASVGSTSVSVSEYTFLGGPKFTVTSKSPVAPFAQILFGGANGSIDYSQPNLSLSASQTYFAVQPGAGIDFNPAPGFGFRFEVDARTLHRSDMDNVGQWRMIGAIVFRM